METLLRKITDAGLDPSSVSGEEAIIFWNHIRQHISTTKTEQAHCYIISSEYRAELQQNQTSIKELRLALNLLDLPNDVEDILTVKSSLSDRLVEMGDYTSALNEFVSSSTIAVEHGYIDEYVMAILGMGNLCDAYSDHNRALRYYQKICSIDHAISSRSLRLKFKLHMVESLLLLNRITTASDLLDECEELGILVSNKLLTAQILLSQAKVLRAQKQYYEALRCLSKIQYPTNSTQANMLAIVTRLEQAQCLSAIGKQEYTRMILSITEKRVKVDASPVLAKRFFDSLSDVCISQGCFQEALNYEKKGYQIETDLIKQIPISELGASQLRRLSRFELQLKLILSEQENRELKETTEQHKNTVARLQQDVFTDPLTGLHNRRWLDVKLKDLLLHHTPFALVVIDIDHFKSINDELSHLVGDKAIVTVSQELRAYFKFKGASCVRFGGEEFLVILDNTDLTKAEMHSEQYRERIDQFGWHEILGERGLTVSIGITLHREGENTQRTFYRADKALYRAKANGRNQLCTE
ncbi:diguanylate cyclase [uncultured Vibrio sp.]|uniref:GGDEF domain-containing protein n=1 Tax=uncultured Vibrio sp. TaxID=114054 RepID=UPI00261A5332|nr:diguanylate cyclase [uncultured Vibrio sp.]